MNYRIREELSFCCAGERIILLDAISGRYLSLAEHQNEPFRRWAFGMPPVGNDLVHLDYLALQGILMRSERAFRPVRPSTVSIAIATSEIAPCNLSWPLAAIVRAMASRLLWAWRVRHWTLSKIISELQRRRDGNAYAGVEPVAPILVKTVQAFLWADLLLGRHDRCLERSLALAAICRRRGLSVTVVIGVQPTPFAAHCWVQHGDVVLNEKPDRVGMFTPILAF